VRRPPPMKISMRLARLLIPAAVLACVFAASADARSRGPCIASQARPLCYHWQGKVTFVADGDTLDVDVYGDGRGPFRVRVTGINATEMTHYSRDPSLREGSCHALEATARLEDFAPIGKRVRLSAQDPASRSGTRKRRAVAVWRNGKWTDVGQILIDEGHALFLASPQEWAHNRAYSRGAQAAAARRANLWDTDSCPGNRQDASFRIWVNWDADGSDSPRYRGEWAKIKNVGTSDVSIGGWWFRDSHHRERTFPSGAVIPAGRSIKVIVGRRPSWDSDHQTRFYWPQAHSVFDNVGSRGLGDGGYLFDRLGNLRSWMMYPCRRSCGDFLKGKITVRAHPKRPEQVYVRNISGVSVNLEGYVVENYPYVYSAPAGTVLHPDEVLRLIVKGSPRSDTRLVRYWGKSRYILNDGGDRVLVRTQTAIRIHCHAWGGRRC
jgi:endonuclease YncB( thermonuclease family)